MRAARRGQILEQAKLELRLGSYPITDSPKGPCTYTLGGSGVLSKYVNNGHHWS